MQMSQSHQVKQIFIVVEKAEKKRKRGALCGRQLHLNLLYHTAPSDELNWTGLDQAWELPTGWAANPTIGDLLFFCVLLIYYTFFFSFLFFSLLIPILFFLFLFQDGTRSGETAVPGVMLRKNDGTRTTRAVWCDVTKKSGLFQIEEVFIQLSTTVNCQLSTGQFK